MSEPASYNDDDLVYVDPATKTVIAKVEFDGQGNPKMCPYPNGKDPSEHGWRTHYPWGTYRSTKRAFRVGGKVQEERRQASLDEVLPKLLNDTL